MVSAVQKYCGPLISVNNSNDETLGHTEDYYFPINFLVLLLFLNYFLGYFTVISHLFLIPYNYFSVISQVFTVRENLGLLMTPLGADYVTRPFFLPAQRKTGKAVWLHETIVQQVISYLQC